MFFQVQMGNGYHLPDVQELFHDESKAWGAGVALSLPANLARLQEKQMMLAREAVQGRVALQGRCPLDEIGKAG